jgi:hypothetical protein
MPNQHELLAENTELRSRLAEARAEIDVLRAEALERRAELRVLAESLPASMSRRALLHSMFSEAAHHPDKLGVAFRGMRRLTRAPKKAVRIARGRG